MSEQFQTNVNRFIDYVKNKINNDHNNMNTYELHLPKRKMRQDLLFKD